MFHNGISGRWTLGVVVLVPLVVYNEVGGLNTILGAFLAALFSGFAATCRSNTKQIQIPYLRTSRRIDFLWLFLAFWMEILTLLAACSVLARTISTCLDNMTGGMARILILGRNSSPNEMWPDVIGVTVVFLVSGMFMLGLENTRIFSVLMLAGMFGIVCQIAIVSFLRGTLDAFHFQYVNPNEKQQIGVVVGCALLCFMYPMENPKKIFGRLLVTKRYHGLMICTAIVLFFVLATTGCLSSLILSHDGTGDESFVAVPTFHIMESHGLPKTVPAVACMLVLASSGALMELFPEMFKMIVQLTTSDWKILAKQIGFENKDTGSPVLAVFISGSLCAMLAFAAPLENMIYILAGSHLMGIVFRTIYLLYIPFRPKIVETKPEATSSLTYSRLDSELGGTGGGPAAGSSAMTISTSFRRLWSMAKSESSNIPGHHFPNKKRRKVLKNPIVHEELEKEWLLLGEPQSPRLDDSRKMSGGGVEIVDTKLIGDDPVMNADDDEDAIEDEEEEEELEDSSDATDIDAIVHEYKEKLRVSGDGSLEANVLRIPTANSWRLSIFLICMLSCAVSLLDLGIYQRSIAYSATGIVALIVITIILCYIPKQVDQKQEQYQHVVISVITLCSSLILTVTTLSQSWPALLFWLVSGLALIIRCDLWCCPCLEKTEEVTIIQDAGFGSTHQLLYLADAHPTLVITNPMLKSGSATGSRIVGR